MAAQILKVGENKIWMDPEKLPEIKEGITKADIRVYIQKKWIKKKKIVGQSRGRTRETQKKKKKGRRTGVGTRKGAKKARTPKKKAWMNKIRIQRRFLKKLKEIELLNTKNYRELYLKAKAGFFRNKAHLKLYAKKFITKEKK